MRVRTQYKSCRGFTAAELVVAIGITGILMLVGIPRYIELNQSFARDKAIREFESVVRRARSEALRRGTRVILTSTSGTDYQLGVDIAPFSNTLVPDSVISRYVLPTNTTLTLTQNIAFSTRGLVIDTFGDPTTVNASFLYSGSNFCSASILSSGVVQFTCSIS